jgi:hypothetical protein
MYEKTARGGGKSGEPTSLRSTSAFPVLSWAAEHPKRWHNIGKMPESRKAAELLAKPSQKALKYILKLKAMQRYTASVSSV